MLGFTRWKIIATLAVCLVGILFAAPNLFPRATVEHLPAWLNWLPHQQVNLGLDLQGGSHLLLQVDSAAVIRERLDSDVDVIREELRKAKIRYEGLGSDGIRTVSVTISDPAQIADAKTVLAQIDPDMSKEFGDDGRFRFTLSEQAIRQREVAAVEQSLEIVRRRIDETGTREPTIQRQGSDRILVQLPGVGDPERIKALIGKTAKMTFHLVDETADLNEVLAGRAPIGSMVLLLVERHKGPAP